MSEVKVDTISERTAAGGVTIDGVLIKDGVATFQTPAGSPLVFEGATANAFETTFAITDPTADRTITFPDSSFTVPTAGGLFSSYAILEDQKTQNTGGGTFTSGAWQTRDLQTEVYDGIGLSIATNAFTLPAGTYLISWEAPSFNVGVNQSRLYDVTGTAAAGQGSSMRNAGPDYRSDTIPSTGSARVTIGSSNAYRIEHYCGTTCATSGFGYPANFGVEVYTRVEIYKES
jgi:hypothetical protein